MKRYLLCLLLLPIMAYAITPPTPVTPTLAQVLYTWDHPTTRADGSTLALSEIKESRLYITTLSAFISIAGPGKSYLFVVPSGQCLRKTDGAQVTAVDTGGFESAGSLTATTPSDVCSGKFAPGIPGNVKATVQ